MSMSRSQRWQAFTGETAMLEGDGRPFADAGERRRRRHDGTPRTQARPRAAPPGRGHGGLWHPGDDISRRGRHRPEDAAQALPRRTRLGETKANAQVAGFLFNSAKNGNVTAQIFWLKTRARWRETPVELQHSGSIGRKDLCEFSDAELIAIIGSAVDVPATLKAHGSERTEPNARGFLDLVANGQYRPKV